MEKYISYNLINSIKGGCGKTTFSLILGHILNNKDNNTLLIDMDLQGTAMQYLFLGNNEEGNKKYINNAIREGINPLEYINNLELLNGDKMDVIFADPRVNTKKCYRASAMSNYTTAVQYQVFRDGFKNFLIKLKKANYSNIIFDMPPNYDGFSNAAIDCIHHGNDLVNAKDKINLFYVTGWEAGQVNAIIMELKEFLNKEDHAIFDNLFVVINDNIVHNESLKQETCNNIIFDKLKHSFYNLQESEIKKIHFIFLSYNEIYAKHCIIGTGLSNPVNASSGELSNDIIPSELSIIYYSSLQENGLKRIDTMILDEIKNCIIIN